MSRGVSASQRPPAPQSDQNGRQGQELVPSPALTTTQYPSADQSQRRGSETRNVGCCRPGCLHQGETNLLHEPATVTSALPPLLALIVSVRETEALLTGVYVTATEQDSCARSDEQAGLKPVENGAAIVADVTLR